MNLKPWASGFAAASCALALMATTSFAATSSGNNKQDSGSATAKCDQNTMGGTPDVVIVYSPTILWPPNHKMQRITLTGIDNNTANATSGDSDSDMFTIAVTKTTVTPPEAVGQGCGNTAQTDFGPDSDPNFPPMATAMDPNNATAYWDVRAERCAREGDRTYTITVHCTETNGGETDSGDAFLTITVPHDQGHNK